MAQSTDIEKAIYYEAIAIQNPQRRAAYLHAVCSSDSVLRKRVQSLLAAEEGAKGFLSASPVDSLLEPAETRDIATDVSDLSNATFRRYRLLEKIGEGGFGIVYMAEQREPIQRRVALKVIKRGMDTQQVIARFEAERQALARMDHPNIAVVLDAGSTENGQPFFAMELVRGLPITEYCDEHNLSTRARLNIFSDVCSAIQHAHQKGIIHRDIKPNNVLVTSDGDRPVPKVIDFGIAKATQGSLTDATLFTQFRQFIGTPAYMSPEQAQLSARDIDTRSDIYSLGVLLYELLTGTTPLNRSELNPIALDEICRLIREHQPLAPSTCLSSMTQPNRLRIARDRSIDPDRLRRLMRGELDWIVGKAMEKDRARRYATASALRADVIRYLANEPVEAAPPTVAYQLWKFAIRNWVAASATAAVALAVISGSILSTIGLIQAHRAKTELLDQLTRTRAAEEVAWQAAFVSEMQRASSAVDVGDIDLASGILANQATAYSDHVVWRCLDWISRQGDALYTFQGHTGPVSTVAVSPQGLMASGSVDRTFRLFDIATRKEVARREVASEILAVEFSPDGQFLAVAEESNLVSVWNVSPLGQIAVFPELESSISDIGFTRHANTLAVATNRWGDPLQLWDWKTQNVVKLSETANGRWLTVSPSGNLIAHFGPLPQVNVAEANRSGGYSTYAKLESIHDHIVLASDFSRPDELYLATAAGSEIKIWGVADAREAEKIGESIEPLSVFQARRYTHNITCLAFSPSGRHLASGSTRGPVRIWRGHPTWQPEESELRTLRGHSGAVNAITYTQHGEYIVSGSDDHTVKLWLGEGHPASNSAVLTEDSVFAVAISEDGSTLAAGCFDGRVLIFDTKTLSKRFDETVHENQTMGIAISPNGKWLASCEGAWRRGGNYGTAGRGIAMINLEQPEDRYYIEDVPTSVGGALDFSPDSRSLAYGDANGGLWLWDVEKRRSRRPAFETQGGMIWCLGYSPDGDTIAIGGKDRPLELRHADSFELIAECVSTVPHAVSFSSDGRIVAFAEANRISLFDASTLTTIQTLEGHLSNVYGVAFFPDGGTLASCSLDRTVKLWNIQSGQEIATLRGHQGEIYGLAISRDGTLFASSGNDKQIRIWRAPKSD